MIYFIIWLIILGILLVFHKKDFLYTLVYYLIGLLGTYSYIYYKIYQYKEEMKLTDSYILSWYETWWIGISILPLIVVLLMWFIVTGYLDHLRLNKKWKK